MSQQASDANLCSDAVVGEFVGGVTMQLWRSNALMVANAVLVAIMVAAVASGRRYRYAAVTRFLFQGASTLYLPIVSYVASSIGKESCSTSGGLDVFCHGRSYVALLLIWTVLVQIVGTNTSAVVAADDYHCGQNLSPSIQLLFRTVWTSYLVFYYAGRGFVTETSQNYTLGSILFYKMLSQYLVVLCLLSLAKIMLMWYAFQKARKSFALGRNSQLIAGYMEKLQGDDESPLKAGLSPAPAAALCGHQNQMIPPFIVMGEDKQQIEETPHGYSIKQINGSLVTIDMVWRMSVTGDALLASQPWLKDLCLSFALSKLLTRRFAKAHIAESGSTKAFSFVLDVLLNNGSADRVFRVMADEISFILDSYYSSLPTSNFGRLLPILNFIVSLSVISWCLKGGAIVSERYSVHSHRNQIYCRPEPMSSCMFPPQDLNDNGNRIAFGNIYFNTLPTLSLFAAVIVAEAWQIVSYLCSNWVKVTMLCHYMTHASWQESPRVQRWLGVVMKLRIRFRRSWSDQMGQRSLLPPSIRRQHACRTMTCRLFFCFSDQKMQYVKVPLEVKAAIVDALRSSNGILTKGTAALHKHSSIIGNSLRWACEGQGTSDVILAWHIATCMVETRHSSTCSSIRSSAANANRAVAMHLSRYCAYLVADAPQLLPDNKEWSGKLYKTVSKDIKHAHVVRDAMTMAARLGDRCEHEVVKMGLRLGKQLMELLQDDEDASWALLASFWSEIVLYVAPSDDLKAHKEAIAHGAELLTLIWALLAHAGITTRPSSTSNAA